MAFVHSKQSRVFLNHKHVSCQLKGFTSSGSRSYAETTALCDEGTRNIPGLMEGSFSAEGMFESDPVNGGIFEVVQSAVDQDNGALFTCAPAGLVIGRPAFIARCDVSSFEVDSSISDAVSLNVEGTPDDGTDWGVLLADHTAKTATGNGTSVDNGAGFPETTRGGVASLHVTAVSGTTPTMTVKIQHSDDNSTWVDLVSFGQVNDVEAQYQPATVITGTIERYVRAVHTIGGTTPSFTFAVAFARR